MKAFNQLLLILLISHSGIVSFFEKTSHSKVSDFLYLSPHWTWRTIETEHFRVSYESSLGEFSHLAAQYLEQAHLDLSVFLRWEPADKTQVLVIGNEDLANGLTSVSERLGMILIATPPENWFSTSYYENWVKTLVYHEYAHFLNMDATRGIWHFFRELFGNTYFPNALWPTWMLEGLAVNVETQFTKLGRGHSSYYEMILRTAVDADVLDSRDFINLGKIQGTNPYFPAGETPYLFGYYLLNHAASFYTDSKDSHGSKDSSPLGELSYRSSFRIPYFLNFQMKDLIDRSWYSVWDDWVSLTRGRIKQYLETIRSQPVTQIRPITKNGFLTLGMQVSPDQKWIAYIQETYDKPLSMYLLNLETLQLQLLVERIQTSGLCFTADSKAILFSSTERFRQHYHYSDLKLVDIESKRVWDLTQGARAKDPHCDRSSNLLAYTVVEDQSSVIMTARLEQTNLGAALIASEVQFKPQRYDVVSNPRFMSEGTKIIFTLHRNGEPFEDLMELEINSKTIRTLVSDQSFNRNPTVSENGTIYFVSDKTGIPNLYRYREKSLPERITNFITGLQYPTFDKNDRLYAATLSYRGWDVSEVLLDERPFSYDSQKVIELHQKNSDGGFAQSYEPTSKNESKTIFFRESEYSVFPSIWPRSWAPFVILSSDYVYYGGMIQGFDAIDRHRYALGLAMDSRLNLPDWQVAYQNRQLGPVLSATISHTTSGFISNQARSIVEYSRQSSLGLSISQSINWENCALIPRLQFSTNNIQAYQVPPVFSQRSFLRQEKNHGVLGGVSFQNTYQSKTAVSPEFGRDAQVFASYYIGNSRPTWKGLLTDTEYLYLFKNIVFMPSFALMGVSIFDPLRISSRATVQGRFSGHLSDGLSDINLDQLSIRGYSDQAFYAKTASVIAAELRFPMFRIYQGIGTLPIFLERFQGFIFFESALFADPPFESGSIFLKSQTGNPRFIPSTGGGVRLVNEIFYQIPVTLAAEYHYGFQKSLGGKGEFVFSIAFKSSFF